MLFCIKNLILILFLISNCAFSYVLTSSEINNTIKNKINFTTKQILSDYEYKIQISQIPQDSFSVSDNYKIEVIEQNQKFSPIRYARVIIKDKNSILKTYPVTIETKVYKNVLVALDNIQYNCDVTKNNTTLEKREISKYFDKVLDNIQENSVSIKNIQKGSIILKNNIKQKALISKNSDIDIIFQSQKGLKITLKGRALKDGALGETITVRSDKYNKTYSAIVQSSTSATVRI